MEKVAFEVALDAEVGLRQRAGAGSLAREGAVGGGGGEGCCVRQGLGAGRLASCGQTEVPQRMPPGIRSNEKKCSWLFKQTH